MIIRNTSNYHISEVKTLIEFASYGFNDKRVCINVKNCHREYYGRAYNGIPSVSNAPRSSNYLVVVRIGKPNKFPCDDFYSTKYKRLTPFQLLSWQEAIIAVTTHELAHVQQFRTHKPLSEVKANKKAYQRVIEWRAKKETERTWWKKYDVKSERNNSV